MERPPFVPVVIGTACGAGFWPWGPGTAGAVLGTLVWLGLWSVLEFAVVEVVVAVLVVVFTLLGTWATARLMPYWGDDPSRVVIDEVVGVWVALLMASDWVTAVVALLLFRVFDILKPFGIRSLDRRRGAFWVMADDLLAGVYAAVCLIPIYLIYLWAA